MRANLTTSTTTQLAPENQIQQNDWAVASAVQCLLGRVSPSALAVALSLAAHIPYDGSRLTVWPSWRRLLSRCGIGSFSTVQKALEELEQKGFIQREGGSRRKSTVYTLRFLTVPDHVVDRTLRAVEKASRAVDASKPSATETVVLSATETVAESYQSNSINKERKKDRKIRRSEGERGTHSRPPRISCNPFDSHPLPRAFPDKSPRPLAKPVECIESTEEGRLEWAKAKILELAGPEAARHLGEGRGDKAPDWQPWLKLGLTRRQWLRKERRERLDDRRKGEDLLSSKAG